MEHVVHQIHAHAVLNFAQLGGHAHICHLRCLLVAKAQKFTWRANAINADLKPPHSMTARLPRTVAMQTFTCKSRQLKCMTARLPMYTPNSAWNAGHANIYMPLNFENCDGDHAHIRVTFNFGGAYEPFQRFAPNAVFLKELSFRCRPCVCVLCVFVHMAKQAAGQRFQDAIRP
eukprot:1158918-Pelagomonas_calceolata.AAC.13